MKQWIKQSGLLTILTLIIFPVPQGLASEAVMDAASSMTAEIAYDETAEAPPSEEENTESYYDSMNMMMDDGGVSELQPEAAEETDPAEEPAEDPAYYDTAAEETDPVEEPAEDPGYYDTAAEETDPVEEPAEDRYYDTAAEGTDPVEEPAEDSGYYDPAAEGTEESTEEVAYQDPNAPTREEIQMQIDRYDALIESYQLGNAADQATLDGLTDQISNIDQTRTDLETQFASYGDRTDEEAVEARRSIYSQLQSLLDTRSPLNIQSNIIRMRMGQRNTEIQDCEQNKQQLIQQLNEMAI